RVLCAGSSESIHLWSPIQVWSKPSGGPLPFLAILSLWATRRYRGPCANPPGGIAVQLPTAIVMVRHASFGINPETAATILFQREPTETSRRDIERRARIEFDMLTFRAREAGVEIIVVVDQEELQ